MSTVPVVIQLIHGANKITIKTVSLMLINCQLLLIWCVNRNEDPKIDNLLKMIPKNHLGTPKKKTRHPSYRKPLHGDNQIFC